MTILHRIVCYRYCLPLRVPVHVAGTPLKERQGLLFALEDDVSVIGWGEAAPLPGFSIETLEDVTAASLHFSRQVQGCSLDEVRERMVGGKITSSSLYFAFDSALGQIERRASGTLHNRSVDTVNLCALVTGDIAAYSQIEKFLHAGYKTVKVKVGAGSVEEDIKETAILLHDFAGACCWRFDANRAWDFADALRFCDVLAGSDAAYVEEPLQEPGLLPQLHKKTGIPYAVDETLQELSTYLFSSNMDISSEEGKLLFALVENAQALVWKPGLCMSPARMGLQRSVPVVLSAAYESGVGTAAILDYAAQKEYSLCAAGIDTYSRLAVDVLHGQLPVFQGEASMQAVRDTAGSVNTKMLKEVWHV